VQFAIEHASGSRQANSGGWHSPELSRLVKSTVLMAARFMMGYADSDRRS
jgi:hypothetical protein